MKPFVVRMVKRGLKLCGINAALRIVNRRDLDTGVNSQRLISIKLYLDGNPMPRWIITPPALMLAWVLMVRMWPMWRVEQPELMEEGWRLKLI
jgi:hypothetical protein